MITVSERAKREILKLVEDSINRYLREGIVSITKEEALRVFDVRLENNGTYEATTREDFLKLYESSKDTFWDKDIIND